MKLGIIFAGQGSQKIGMGKDLYEVYPEFRNSFDCLQRSIGGLPLKELQRKLKLL